MYGIFHYYLTIFYFITGLRFGLIQTKLAIVCGLLKNRLSTAPDTPDPIKFQAGSLVLMAEGVIHLRIEPI